MYIKFISTCSMYAKVVKYRDMFLKLFMTSVVLFRSGGGAERELLLLGGVHGAAPGDLPRHDLPDILPRQVPTR